MKKLFFYLDEADLPSKEVNENDLAYKMCAHFCHDLLFWDIGIYFWMTDVAIQGPPECTNKERRRV